MPLTDIQIRQAKAQDKDYKLSDGGGLYLLVRPGSKKFWRQKYRFLGKEKTLAHGEYPLVTLAEAREKRDEAKRMLMKDIDPGQDKKQKKAELRFQYGNTFEHLARDWHGVQSPRWTKDHADRVIHSLEQDVFPYVGDKPITQIMAPELVKVIKRVEQREALELANRLIQRCNSVFQFAIQTGLATDNPANALRGIVKKRRVQHRASIPRQELPEFLRKLENYDGHKLVQYGVQLLVLTFVRPGELRFAKWEEFDLKNQIWRIEAERMKMKTPHVVPLSTQAIDLLGKIKPISGQTALLFPGERSRIKPISENTLNGALNRMGYKGRATAHGFRATASSILNESGLFNSDAIERQLSHQERNGVRAAYTHHAEYLDERKHMMQWWADYLDEVRQSKMGNQRL